MRGVGDFGAGQRQRPEDERSDAQAGRRGDGPPRDDVGSKERRDARGGRGDARDRSLAQDAGAQSFRRRLSAALGEGADDAMPSGAEELASLFRPAVAPSAPDRDSGDGGTVGDAPASRPPPSGLDGAPAAVPADREPGRAAAEAWKALIADAGSGADREAGTGSRGKDPAADRELRLLAVSDAVGLAGPAWTPFAPSRPDAAGETATDARIERAVAWVSEAIRAEEAAGAAGPITLSVPLQFQDSGLVGVAVTLSADGIDVVLSRAAGMAASDAALAEAARDLVSRLQRRAPRGVVRVLDAVGEAPAAARREAAGTESVDRLPRS